MATAIDKEFQTAVGRDAWCLGHIDPELLLVEPELFDTTWFDYKALHPLARTVQFARAYFKVVSEVISKQIDFEDAKHYARANKSFNLLTAASAKRVTFWRARQQADRIGAPYEIYIRAVLLGLRDRGWKRIPSPSHLFSEQALELAADAWLTALETQIHWPAAARGCDAESTTWFKNDFDDWFVGRAFRRPAWSNILQDAIRKNVMTKEQVRRALFDLGVQINHGKHSRSAS